MDKNCIVCGKELIKISCTGSIEDMSVEFCDEHANYCDNCDTVICKVKKE